jgi:hypothetical protein
MKRDEFLLGAFVYALIIAAGFCRPLLEKWGNSPWNKPLFALVQNRFRPPVPVAKPQASKALLVSKVRQILAPDTRISVPALAQDSIRKKLAENWKRMASHPAGLGTETESAGNAPTLAGGKADLKINPLAPERKAAGGEATKG